MLKSILAPSTLRQTISRAGIRPTPSSLLARLPPPQPRLQQQIGRHISTARLFGAPQRLRAQAWRTHGVRRTRHNSSKPSIPVSPEDGSKAAQSLSGRFKALSKKYGWAAVGVYLGLSVLDFPFCFLAVRLVGPDRIGEWEHAIVQGFWSLVGMIHPSMKPGTTASAEAVEAEVRENIGVEVEGHKIKENASIWTQLLLAYGVHKSLIFFRVPLTAAVTPKIVKTLRSWGWNIGPRTKIPRST